MGTYNQVPEQHVSTSTYKVAHTTQVPHTGYTTSYRTEEVPYAKKAGYLRRLAEASTDTDAAQASLTKKGTLKYGEKVVSTHTTTYYKTKTNYKYVAKPYTVVTHLVCTPSTHVEYRCPACHGGDNSYAGVADSFGAWLSPAQTGEATHVYHHVYHTASETASMGFGDYKEGEHANWRSLDMSTQSLHQAASTETTSSSKSSSGTGVVIGASVTVAVAAVAMIAVALKRRQKGESNGDVVDPLSIL